MKYVAAIFVACLALAPARTSAEDVPAKLVDISGTYSDVGMTIRATEGAPSATVSLDLLLARVVNPESHRTLAAKGGVVKITQQGDAQIDVHSGSDTPASPNRGGYVDKWTKANGLKVDAEHVVISLRPPRKRMDGETRLIDGTYTFSLDEEKRLVVSVDFVITKHGAIPPTTYETGVYAFPRADTGR